MAGRKEGRTTVAPVEQGCVFVVAVVAMKHRILRPSKPRRAHPLKGKPSPHFPLIFPSTRKNLR